MSTSVILVFCNKQLGSCVLHVHQGREGGGCRGAGGRARELMGLFTGAWWFLATS
jgi:hypothetical protein